MKGLFLFLLMVVAAVFLGLAIAVWYLSRFVENGGPVRTSPQAVPFPEKHAPVDVTPKLASLSQQPSDATTTPDSADVDGLMRRLAAIESEQEDRPAPADKEPKPHRGEAYHEKDDLKRISGIGPKLEGVLNAHGIFSFRQIAAWQATDIDAIDKLLPAFHGRIARDDWVGQARRLRDQ